MKYFLPLIVLVLYAACSNHTISEETLNADAALLANLQCEAKKLQEERFQLATDIRLLEDSMMTAQDSVLLQDYQRRLEVLEPRKEDMLSRTKAMADSISNVIAQLHQGTYKDTSDRKLLDVALTAQFERICR